MMPSPTGKILARLALALLLTASLPLPCSAQTYVPGQTYWGRNDYIEYIAGDLPFIISASHGGTLTPAELPDRTSGTLSRDMNTDDLARSVGTAMFSRYAHHPHVIICQLNRIKIDCNREIVEGAQGNALTEISWNEFQNFITSARQMVQRQFGRGFYIDLHGHGHTIARLELGYLLTSNQLGFSDTTLNGNATYTNQSSIRELTLRSPSNFATLLRGNNSLGARLVAAGYPSVPSPSTPSPGSDPYFNGGYNTVQHGSQPGGTVSAVQIEAHNAGVRDTAANRDLFATRLAEALGLFYTDHFELNLADGLPTISSIANQTVGVNGTTSLIPFSIGDAVTAPAALMVSLASSNPTLIPTGGMVLGGSNASRTLLVSPATDKTGSGIITVTVTDSNGGMVHQEFTLTVTATPIQVWRLAHFGTASATGPAADLADPDFDGLCNLLEFALLGLPSISSTSVLPVLARSGSNLTLTYSRSKQALAEGLVFAVETALTPNGTWTVSGVTEAVLLEDAERQQMRATITTGAEKARFARLKVTRP